MIVLFSYYESLSSLVISMISVRVYVMYKSPVFVYDGLCNVICLCLYFLDVILYKSLYAVFYEYYNQKNPKTIVVIF